MKTQISTLAILLLISGNLFGQFAIDPGNDTILCVSAWGLDTTILGGSPTATGGTEPYTYAWTPNYNISDTTISNPRA